MLGNDRHFKLTDLVDFIQKFPDTAAAAATAAAPMPNNAIKIKQQFRDVLKYLLAYTTVPTTDPQLLKLQNLNVLQKIRWFFGKINIEDYYRTTIIKRNKKLLKGVFWATKTLPPSENLFNAKSQYGVAVSDLDKLVELYKKKTTLMFLADN